MNVNSTPASETPRAARRPRATRSQTPAEGGQTRSRRTRSSQPAGENRRSRPRDTVRLGPAARQCLGNIRRNPLGAITRATGCAELASGLIDWARDLHRPTEHLNTPPTNQPSGLGQTVDGRPIGA